ncbi:MAG: DUF362 domain-containing protein [Bacillota bacterium]
MTEVAIVRCGDYTQDRVDKAVLECLDLVGGLAKWVKPGDRVLLKANILSAKPPEAGVTTHPAVIKAVIRAVQMAGGIPSVGDSSGGIIAGQSPTRVSLVATGIQAAAEEMGAQVVNFDLAGVREIPNPGGRVPVYHIAGPVFEADVVISLPKLKTHSATLFTGAVKNMYGTIPGFRKAEYHRLAPKPADFAEVLVDIFARARVKLAIMDGILAMEGNGPAAGPTRSLGLLLASGDSVALDVVASSIIGFNPLAIATTRIAGARGLGEADINKITVHGVPLEQARIRDFALPSNALLERLPDFVVKGFLGVLKARPEVDPDKCTGCEFCVQNCPVGVMELQDRVPAIEYDKCISCLCCQELCPRQAVELKQHHPAGKLLAAVIGGYKRRRNRR